MEKYLILCSACLLFTSITIFVYYILDISKTIRNAKTASISSGSSLLHTIMPLLSIIAPLNKKLELTKYRSIMALKFRKAGAMLNLTVDIFLAAKELTFVLFLLIYILFYGIPTSALSLFAICTMGTLGFFVPNLILNSHIKDREKKIIRELPYVLDLLTVSVEAGLDFMKAVERVVDVLKNGELVKELAIMKKSLQVGESRKTALRQLAYRTEVSDVKAVVSALVQADQLGTGIGNVLRTVSDQARSKRSQRAEKMAGEATVKLLLPLLLVFFAVMLMVLGPVVLQIIGTFQ